MIPLDIFADPVCPWCYIGKARLDRALEARPGHPFVIAWHPFELNPTLPAGGMARDAYLTAKFGVEAAKYHIPVLEAAKDAGVTMDLAAITRMPNTRDAHRLLHWAGIEGRQTPVMSALMRAYWREGRDIGDPAVLTEIAVQMGMEGEMVARLLATDADLDTIAAREAHARERGIDAVPAFVIGNSHLVTGAQPTSLWLQVIDELSGQQGAD
ncbi:MAG: DsbA family oxidoreductase [Paenirhodobacter sp.]|uniref:DsbA family oxidoreductase n=1 Tax=Paenirhodobacter sp. TaxID=1965326 RepID=UPI003D10A4AD